MCIRDSYEPARRDPEAFHGTGPYDIATGRALKKPGRAPSYTEAVSYTHLDVYKRQIKDMAGMLTPYRAERMVKAFNEEIGLPVHIHCHYVGGMAPANILSLIHIFMLY